MTTPTPEPRDPDRTDRTDRADRNDRTEREPETRHRLDLSVTKVAAGACASALAAAVGSQLGVAGTIAGAAVASVVATSASAVIGHSLERGKSAARKAMPVLDPEQLETAILSRARMVRAERTQHDTKIHAAPVHGTKITDTKIHDTPAATHSDEPPALTRVDETVALPSLADRALTDSGLDETVVLDGKRLPQAAPDAARTWKDRIPGRKPLLAAAVASFMLGTGAVTALEVARKGEFPGYHSNVFTDPGQSGGSHDEPSRQDTGGGTHENSTPSQKPDSSSPSPSGSTDSPSTTGSTPNSTDSTPSTPSTPGTPSTTPSTGATGTPGPSTTPPTSLSGSANPTTAPSTTGAATQSSSADGLGKATPTGGPTG